MAHEACRKKKRPRPFLVYDRPIFSISPIVKLLLIVNKAVINAGYPVGVVFQ